MNNLSKTRGDVRFMGRVNAGATSAAAVQSCTSCGCTSFQTTAVARYDENGDCANLGKISCETQWKMRDCLKVALCEFLGCLGDEFCKDGTFKRPVEVDPLTGLEEEKDLGDVLLCCLGNATCSVLHCLPSAICGPQQNNDCIPPPALECNFAVEERD